MQIMSMYVTADGQRFYDRRDAEQHEQELPLRITLAQYAPAELVERELHNRMTNLVRTIQRHAGNIADLCAPDEDWPFASEYTNGEEILRQAQLIEELTSQLSQLQDRYETVAILDPEAQTDAHVCQYNWCEQEPINAYGWCSVHMDPKYWCHTCWQRHAVDGVGESAMCAECKKGERS